MALARIKTIEDTRYCSPGELGKIIGMDRCPEAKTLRGKVALLSANDSSSGWGRELSEYWLNSRHEGSGLFYIDGHVRVYNGSQTRLPRHHVARLKLCMRATTDYWVNAMDGRPFFLVNKPVDPGLVKVIENDIFPRLDKAVPGQPTEEQLKEAPHLHRFTFIFDREGYSPDFFLRMKVKRIACISYHKHPKEDWPLEEFSPRTVKMVTGGNVTMLLAERGTWLGGKLWVREIRKLNESGKQTSVIASDFTSDITFVAAAMFSRWSQENFFKYMRLHFGIDRLVDYSLEEMDETQKVVNPEWRSLDGSIRGKVGKLGREKIMFSELIMNEEIEPEKVEEYQKNKAKVLETITVMADEIDLLKKQRKEVGEHIEIGKLPEKERFKRLSGKGKEFVDTVKMIAYRAETAMANILREKMKHPDEARKLLQAIYTGEADITPDVTNNTLTVSLHHLAAKGSSDAIKFLCNELNETETCFPDTNLKMIYKLVSN